MKTTSKILLAVIALFIINSSSVLAKGGDNGRFSVGAEVALPMGDFGDAVSLGIGGTLRYEMPMGDNLALMITAGYMTFSGKTPAGAPSGYDAPSWNMIPAQVGAKYYFTEQQNGFYAEVQVGIHSTSYTVPEQTYTTTILGQTFTTTTPEVKVSSTDLSYAPGIGYHLDNIDLGVRYQIISTTGSTTSYLGLRLAYVFGER